jgi:maltose O-acetyltransferase
LIGKHLPDTSFPGGEVYRFIRQELCKRFIADAGGWINVEADVYIADGSHLRMGYGSNIGPGGRVYGATIGEFVNIGAQVTILKQNHRFEDTTEWIGLQGDTDPDPPVLEDGVWIGDRVIILPGVRIGRGAIVGAGAIVTRDVPPNHIVAGNPARTIRVRGESPQA